MPLNLHSAEKEHTHHHDLLSNVQMQLPDHWDRNSQHPSIAQHIPDGDGEPKTLHVEASHLCGLRDSPPHRWDWSALEHKAEVVAHCPAGVHDQSNPANDLETSLHKDAFVEQYDGGLEHANGERIEGRPKEPVLVEELSVISVEQ